MKAPDFAERACQKTIYGPRVTSWQCFRRGVAQEREVFGGKPRGAPKWWCKQHLPSNERSREDARGARYRAERAADERHWAREAAKDELMTWARENRDAMPIGVAPILARYDENVI